ncbi:hypothetical protein BUALT_Bualt04G0049700 [Buddleja alternifolia]|uniref:Uncharacterized protein n=1 Tax=Buddleja alternifolia TaxID=168488 RepID=A0AAV6XMS1_9LAMI|nr:hypothetical protein BUALT_Bualt04G0049700 [Buddleja alternifolia]
MYCPIDILNWCKVLKYNKKELLGIVQLKFIGIHGMDEWILQSIGEKWRLWKQRLKVKYLKPDMPFEYLVKNTDERVIEEQWKGLLTFWLSEEGKLMAQKNLDDFAHVGMGSHLQTYLRKYLLVKLVFE